MKVLKLLLLAACLSPAISNATPTLIDFNGLTSAVGVPAPAVSAGGVTVSFMNLEVAAVGDGPPLFDHGFFAGATAPNVNNQVVAADQVNFNGKFLTALGFREAFFRSPGFVRTIVFDTAVTNVSMYIADIDAGEGITAIAFNEFDAVLSTMVFPRTVDLDGRVQLVDFGNISGIRKVTLAGNDPVGIDNLSFGEIDSDGDGVNNSDDFCPDTSIPEAVPTVILNPNHWALSDDDTDFDTVTKGKGPGRSYTTVDTAGCSCEQIIAAQGLGDGHTMHGCSISAMDDWVELVNP